MDDELLAPMSTAHSENIGLFGTITVDTTLNSPNSTLRPPAPGKRPPVVADVASR